jgi:hypothetical protein
MRTSPTIQLYSDDAPRHCESGGPGIAIRLSATVVFGTVVYAATQVGRPGARVGLALLAIVTAAFAVPAVRRTLL